MEEGQVGVYKGTPFTWSDGSWRYNGQVAGQDVQSYLNSVNNPVTAESIFGDSMGDDYSQYQGVLDIWNSKLSSELKDYFIQDWFNSHNAEKSFNRELEADNTKYQRMVQDLQKAGLNPFLAISGLGGGSVSSQAAQVSGGYATQRKNQKDADATKIGGSIAAAIAGIIGALVIALL